MFDEEKVKVMTKLAIYEKGEGKKDLPLSKYYKRDYIKYNILKTVVYSTFAYWLIIAGLILINLEKLLTKINDIKYINVVTALIIGYVVFLIFYSIITKCVYTKKYEKAVPKIIIYNFLLKKLMKYYEDRENSIIIRDHSEDIRYGGEHSEYDDFIKH